MGKNKLLNKVTKVLASIAVGAGSLINPITSVISVSAETSDEAMQNKADTLVGNENIDCWAGSANILKAADLLFFADDYEAKLLKVENGSGAYTVSGDQSKVILSDDTQYQLQVGDVLAFYSTTDKYDSGNGMPNHTMTYVGNTASSESSDTKPYLNANINNTTMYTDNTYYSSLAVAEVRRYSRTSSVNVPVTVTENDPSNVLTLTDASVSYVPVTNHVTGGKVSAATGDIQKAIPSADYQNANFSGKSGGVSVTIEVIASAAYYDESSNSRYYKEITSGTTIYHGRESESNFDSKINGQIGYMLSDLPNAVTKATGDSKFANENIRVRSIKLIYNAVAGGDSSSDNQRKITYHVTDGTTEDTSETEVKDVNTTVTYKPTVAADKVFDGWYTDATGTTLFNNVVPAIGTGEVKGDDGYYPLNLYGFIRNKNNHKVTLNITTMDTTNGTDNKTPLAGVVIKVTNSDGETVAEGTTNDSGVFVPTTGSVTNLTAGIYTVTETQLPTAESGYSYGTSLQNATSNTISIIADTAEDIEFDHNKIKVITATFVAKASDSDPDSDYTFPQSGYPTQTTSAGGYITKPLANPTRNGYTFEGWYTENGTEYDFNSAITSEEDFTLYAKWEEVPKKTIHVTFVDDISNDDEIKAAWKGNDLSSYNFDVEVTKGTPSVVKNADNEQLATILDEIYGLGYKKKDINEKFPSSVSYTTDESGADVEPEDIVVHLIHGTSEQSDDTTTVDVIRTIEFRYDSETGEKAKEDVTQTGQKQKTGSATVSDLVKLVDEQGEELPEAEQNQPIVTEGTTSVKYGWTSYKVPEIADYTADKAEIPAVTDVEYDDFEDTTVVVVYTKNPTVEPVTVTITGKVEEVTYDGTEHSVTGYTVSSSNPNYTESDFHVTEQKTATRTNTGTTALGLAKEQFINDNTNFDVTFVVTDGKLVINPKQVVISANDASKTVGETDPAFEATVTGLLGEDTVDYSVYRAKGEAAGTYKIFTSGAKTQGNYQITYVNGTFTINPKEKPTPEPTATPDIPEPTEEPKDYTGWHTDIDDAMQTVTFPGIHTTASDTTESATDSDKEEYYYISDVVEYVGLTAETPYKLTGTLHIKNSDGTDGGALEGVEPVTKTFTPHTSDGTYTMVFKVPRSLIRNKTVVVFETLYEDTTEIAVHADITDEPQTVTFIEPEIKTTAVDTDSKTHQILVFSSDDDKTVSITDTVEYKNLKPNKNYVLTGTIHVNENGEDAGTLTLNGVEVTASQTFTPSQPNGTVDMVFTFDGSTLTNGQKLVVFEDLKQSGTTVATHADITDEGQTVTITISRDEPDIIHTTATGDNDHDVEVSKTATIKDTVEYHIVRVNQEHTLKGELYVVEEGEEGEKTVTGSPIATVTRTFTPTVQNGTEVMTFTNVDISELEGKSLVVYEYLYKGSDTSTTPIATHTDPNDTDQTVNVKEKVPTIGTTATGLNNSKIVRPEENVSVTDVIAYNKLIAGVTYTMKGELHKRATDGTDAGVIKTVTKTFTPETDSGTLQMVFDGIDASELEGYKLVVFEYCYKGENPVEEDTYVAKHEDINDGGQTVTVQKEIPTLKTTATSENGGKELEAGTSVKVVDTVTYTGLTVGTEYTLKGTLNLISTSKIVEKVMDTQTIKFTPTTKDGSVKVTFTVNTSDLKGRSLVVFEELFQGDTSIAAHADINDGGQTVTVKPDKETPPTPTPGPSAPGLRTLAYNAADGYDTVYPNKSVTINDVVYYYGLQPYVEYTIEGALHIKNTDGTDGGVLYSNGRPVVASKTFTPTTSDGETEISFTFDASQMNGVVCVAFEQLYITKDHQFLQSHEDITDDDQTMWIDRNPKRRRRRRWWIRTGTGRDALIYGGTGLVAVIALAIVLGKRKKSAKAE